ncbi:hypothetical protein FHG87_018616 [Trinorchestia longiramus]|nr:hypothetical protein FHG87_018616 [Trinorchestia longiramus]
MNAHTIAESLIMPAAKILVSHVIGEEAVAKLESVSFSNNTVQRRIEEMSVDQMVEGVKSSKNGFSIQLDKSTDVTNCSQLLVYVRFTQTNAAKTELLLSQDLSNTTTGKEFISKLGAFVRKLDLWIKNVESKLYGMFELLTTLESEPTNEFAQEIVHHLSLLKTELKHYFPDVTCCAYVANQFSVDPADLAVGTREQKELIGIQTDETAKMKHKECSPLNFWVTIASSYSTQTRHAVPQLLIFPSSWECEQGFSAFMTIKSKSRNRLDTPEHDFRCGVSKVQLNFVDQLALTSWWRRSRYSPRIELLFS